MLARRVKQVLTFSLHYFTMLAEGILSPAVAHVFLATRSDHAGSTPKPRDPKTDKHLPPTTKKKTDADFVFYHSGVAHLRLLNVGVVAPPFHLLVYAFPLPFSYALLLTDVAGGGRGERMQREGLVNALLGQEGLQVVGRTKRRFFKTFMCDFGQKVKL
jgi:hypothetical protein